MNLLLSNDDGYLAPGLECLAAELGRDFTTLVVAPDRDRSGASNSLTLNRGLRPQRAENGFLYVDGTPTDCVHLAISGLCDTEPDVVVSGINAGPNLGDDVIYSGTVAAAMEGRFLGLPALAVSLALAGNGYYGTAARVVHILLDNMASNTIPVDTMLNVNVPDIPFDALKGIAVTRLGQRHKAEPVIRSTGDDGEPVFWVGPPGAEQDAGPGTDFHAVRTGFVSITPMHIDLTRHAALTGTSAWVETFKL